MAAVKNLYISKIIIAYFCSILFVLVSCDAPRNNPVDPLNEDNKLSQLSGVVQTLSIPHKPIENASVYWKQGNSLVYTDNLGRFSIPNVTNDNGILVVEKEGYQSDSLQINWGSDKNLSIESSLNFVPVVDSILFYSIVEENPAGPNSTYNYKLEASLKIFDEDNDVDSVFMINPALEFQGVMDYNTLTKEYERRFLLRELGIESANELIGKDFQIIVKDRSENIFNLGQTNVKRIINTAVTIGGPYNQDTVSVPFNLNWQRFRPGFDFTYQAEIYTQDIDKTREWQKNIASTEITFVVEKQLDPGSYFWIIWCIDEFGNRSRSKQATFNIK